MITRTALSLALMISAAPALAENAFSGQQTAWRAAACANCHGTDGRLAGAIPAIANRPASALESQIVGFKHDENSRATVMNRIAKGYSDDELRALAEHFATIGSGSASR